MNKDWISASESGLILSTGGNPVSELVSGVLAHAKDVVPRSLHLRNPKKDTRCRLNLRLARKHHAREKRLQEIQRLREEEALRVKMEDMSMGKALCWLAVSPLLLPMIWLVQGLVNFEDDELGGNSKKLSREPSEAPNKGNVASLGRSRGLVCRATRILSSSTSTKALPYKG